MITIFITITKKLALNTSTNFSSAFSNMISILIVQRESYEGYKMDRNWLNQVPPLEHARFSISYFYFTSSYMITSLGICQQHITQMILHIVKVANLKQLVFNKKRLLKQSILGENDD